MKPTIPYIRAKFADFNRQIFAGRLPEPLISLCEVTSFVGQYKSKIRHFPDGSRELYDHQIRFSTLFDLPEQTLEDTIIHEMIHYFISYNGLHDRTAHGPLFKAMLQSVNEHHGRNITISHRSAPGEIDRVKVGKTKWHVIAILHFTTGETGVKVLPRVIPKIIAYYRQMTSYTNIAAIELYLHNDPFFNRYPTSVGRRCHAITEPELRQHLKGAHTLKVEGSKLVQK